MSPIEKQQIEIYWHCVTLIVLMATGTTFFIFVENWTFIDALQYTLVTMSTVGYVRYTSIKLILSQHMLWLIFDYTKT